MRLNVVFVVAAIYLLLVAIASVLAPLLPDLLGEIDAQTHFTLIVYGVASLSLALIAWLVRNEGPSKIRDSVVLGFTVLFALWAVASLYGQLAIPELADRGSWVQALIQALIAVGFFVTGRSSRVQSVA